MGCPSPHRLLPEGWNVVVLPAVAAAFPATCSRPDFLRPRADVVWKCRFCICRFPETPIPYDDIRSAMRASALQLLCGAAQRRHFPSTERPVLNFRRTLSSPFGSLPTSGLGRQMEDRRSGNGRPQTGQSGRRALAKGYCRRLAITKHQFTQIAIARGWRNLLTLLSAIS